MLVNYVTMYCYHSTGSSGGNGSGGHGGVGGGILFLNISRRLTVNGDLVVNAQNAQGEYAGGGSAGSLFVVTHRLDGSGKIQVIFVYIRELLTH